MRVEIETVEQEQDHWQLAVRLTDGDGGVRRVLALLPTDTLEWRSAEYAIDPADTATLVDVAVVEMFMAPTDYDGGHQLHTAPDIATARADHLARCARVKLRHRITTRSVGHPLHRVASESPLDREVIELKRQLVAQARAHVAAEPPPAPDRADALRAALAPATSTRPGGIDATR